MTQLGLLVPEQVKSIVAEHPSAKRFGEIAVERGYVSRERLFEVVQKQVESIVTGALSEDDKGKQSDLKTVTTGRWDGTQWHEVASINGAEFSMELGIGYKPRTITAADFWQDRDHLLQLAQEVLLG